MGVATLFCRDRSCSIASAHALSRTRVYIKPIARIYGVGRIKYTSRCYVISKSWYVDLNIINHSACPFSSDS